MKDQLDEYVKEHGLEADNTMLLDTDDYYVVLRVKDKSKYDYKLNFETLLNEAIENYNGNLTKYVPF